MAQKNGLVPSTPCCSLCSSKLKSLLPQPRRTPQTPVQIPLQHYHRKRPQITGALSPPLPLRHHLRQRLPPHPITLRHAPRRQRPAPRPPVIPAGHPIPRRRPPDLLPSQIQPTNRTMPQLRPPPHQPIHPQTEISNRQPNSTTLHRPQHRQRQPKHVVLRRPLRHRFFQHLHHKLHPRQPQPIHRSRQRRPQNLKPIHPDQILLRPLRIVRPHMRSRLQSPTKPPPAPHRMPSHALHPALLTRKKADQQIGLMERPRPQHKRLLIMRNDFPLGHAPIVSPPKSH
jgi:hypothetical protein